MEAEFNGNLKYGRPGSRLAFVLITIIFAGLNQIPNAFLIDKTHIRGKKSLSECTLLGQEKKMHY